MKPVKLKVARIGNSRGVRLPAATLDRYGVGGSLIMEERTDGILLRLPGDAAPKLSWEETAQEIAHEAENWNEWDETAGDGLDEIPWHVEPARRVAERKADYQPARRSRKQ